MFGILHKMNKDVLPYLNTMLDASRENKEDGWILTSETDAHSLADIDKLSPNTSFIFSRKPFTKKCTFGLEGNIFNGMAFDTRTKATIQDRIREILAKIDGEYALALTNGSEIAVARDALGRKPVFFAQNDQLTAFASHKKYLWEIGLKNAKPLRAGHLAVLNRSGIQISKAVAQKKPEVTQENFEQIVVTYHKLIHEAVVKRLKDFRKVGVLLSGGVDSTLLAKFVLDLSKRLGTEVITYTAGTESSIDVAYAKRFAQATGLNHKIKKLGIKELEDIIPRVIKAVEERDFVQIEAGIGVFAAEEIAAQDGIEVIFSGQGPDELWGGYNWYPKLIEEEGYEKFQEFSLMDLQRADIETLDRENKIASTHGLEVVFPYIDNELVDLAMSVPPQLKIFSSDDKLGKRPHREMAKRAGVPPEFADRGKDAAQHGTGIHDLLSILAQRKGFDPQKIDRINYSGTDISIERLGSSSRYGYKYDDKSKWMIDENIQFFFDVMAYGMGLLNEQEREKIAEYINAYRRA